MKLLIIAPQFGGIDIYVNKLSRSLKAMGVAVDIVGSHPDEGAYDLQRKQWKHSYAVKAAAADLLKQISLSDYDLLAFHYGKNDIEQYIPVLLTKAGVQAPPCVYFVHFLSWNLFSDYLDDQQAHREVESCTKGIFDGYVFFGRYASDYMRRESGRLLNGIVSYLPGVHSDERISENEEAAILPRAVLDLTITEHPLVFLPGYAADYKDHRLLLSAFEYVEAPMRFVFLGIGWEKRLGFDRKIFNRVETFVVERSLSPLEFGIVCRRSSFGIFPYRQPGERTQVFQGSGTLPNFISEGKACIVLDDGVMAEYVADAGIVVKEPYPEMLGKAINRLLDPQSREQLEARAKIRAALFNMDSHARSCLSFFSRLIQPDARHIQGDFLPPNRVWTDRGRA